MLPFSGKVTRKQNLMARRITAENTTAVGKDNILLSNAWIASSFFLAMTKVVWYGEWMNHHLISFLGNPNRVPVRKFDAAPFQQCLAMAGRLLNSREPADICREPADIG